MSNDLISRSALLEEINSDENRRADTLMREWYADMVSRQPTAYDVDKVMEQIRTSGTDEDGIVLYVDRKPVIAKELVAEIVKSGGIE